MTDSKQSKQDEAQVQPQEEPKAEETPKESTASKDKETGRKTIRFQLRDNKLMWNSKSGNIKLSAFKQETGGKVDSKKNPDDYADVRNAIRLEILEELDEGDFRQFESKNLTAGVAQAEREAKIAKSYSTEEVLNLKQEDAIVKVDEITDPRHIIALIQAEKQGKNETNVERPNVLNKLRGRLKEVDTQGLFEFEGEL